MTQEQHDHYFERTQTALKQGDEMALNTIIQELQTQFPEDATAWFRIGYIMDEIGQYPQALQAYNKALELNPDDAAANSNKGATLEKLQRYPEALQAYNKALELDPDYAIAHNNKGNTLQNLQRYPEALEAYNMALVLAPDYATAHNNKGATLRKLQRYPEAIAAYRQAIRLDPEYGSPWFNWGILLYNQQQDTETAQRFLKRAYPLLMTRRQFSPTIAQDYLTIFQAQAPFFVLRIMEQNSWIQQLNPHYARRYRDLLRETTKLREFLAFVRANPKTCPDKASYFKLLGMVQLFMGDDEMARAHFVELDNDPALEGDLQGQYYYLLSLAGMAHPDEADALENAVELADEALAKPNPHMILPYYGALLYQRFAQHCQAMAEAADGEVGTKASVKEEAAAATETDPQDWLAQKGEALQKAFNALSPMKERWLAAAYQGWLLTRQHSHIPGVEDLPAQRKAFLKAVLTMESQRLSGQPNEANRILPSFLKRRPADAIDLSRKEWQIPFYLYTQYTETAPARQALLRWWQELQEAQATGKTHPDAWVLEAFPQQAHPYLWDALTHEVGTQPMPGMEQWQMEHKLAAQLEEQVKQRGQAVLQHLEKQLQEGGVLGDLPTLGPIALEAALVQRINTKAITIQALHGLVTWALASNRLSAFQALSVFGYIDQASLLARPAAQRLGWVKQAAEATISGLGSVIGYMITTGAEGGEEMKRFIGSVVANVFGKQMTAFLGKVLEGPNPEALDYLRFKREFLLHVKAAEGKLEDWLVEDIKEDSKP